MKRMLFLLVSCVILFAQCEHPYEQDLIGSFPFADMLDENPGIFTSDAAMCVLRVSTNMVITTKTTYVEGGSENWLTVESDEEKGGIVRLTLKIDDNIRREIRQAEVTVYADGSTTVDVVTITQKAYVVDGKENVCEGDLVLKTQDEIDNCIYTKVNGNLIIGGYTGDIRDLSPLEVITAVTGEVRIFGCNVNDMGPLGNLEVRSVVFDSVNPELVRTWRGSVKEVTVRNIGSGNVSLSSFSDAEKLVLSGNLCTFSGYDALKKVKVAEMKSNEFTDTEGMEEMVALDSLYLSDNPLVNVNSLAEMTWLKKLDLSRTDLVVNQIYYLQQYLDEDTEIVCDGISADSSLALQSVEIKYFSAKFEARYDSKIITISSGTNSYGCILSTADEFSTQDLLPLKFSTNPLTFDLRSLTPDTQYYLWLYAVDENEGIHISEKFAFTTPEIVYEYKGDLVLETQDDVDECVHVTVSGNLIIGKEGSDIQDISKLTITAVGGGVTVRGCHLLGDFGPVNDFSGIKYLELDDVSASLPYQWNGSVTDLRIRNISTGTVNLSKFNALTHLTLQSNNCGFSGWSSLTKVTDAVLSGNQFTTTDDFAEMKMLKNIDLRNNPLVNVNSLVEMTSLQKIDLSETMLSQTQVNYLKCVLPSTVVVTDDNLKGTASLSVHEELAKYRSAVMAIEHYGFPSSLYYCGYVLSKISEFPGIDGLQYIDESIPDSFEITDLEADTEYYVWFVVVDNVGSYHLSEPATFRTKKIVENYVGDLVLKTQDDVDECVHTSVTGNLTIGGTDSDIYDLSSLGIKSVSGDLTITGCSSLSSFGGIKNLSVMKVILDKTNQAITKTWEGEADALIIRNTTGTSSCPLSAFDEITSLTLSDNNCSFINLDKLVNLTEADLPRNKLNNTVLMGAWTKIKTLNLNGNPLSNINELAQLTTLTSLDLSDTPLSPTQVRYVQACLPTATVKADDITGTSEITVSCSDIRYFSAFLTSSISDIDYYSTSSCGYYVSRSSILPGVEERVQKNITSTSFEVTSLDDGTEYHVWTYVIDNYSSVHLSEPVTFNTVKVVDTYVGDLVLKTQNDVDECYYKYIEGNLTIGAENSDISDLRPLRIESVSGKLTITDCPNLWYLGKIFQATTSHLHLDSLYPTMTKNWTGETSELTITNFSGWDACSLSPFVEIKKLTLSSNDCLFSGLDSLVNVVEANLANEDFTVLDDFKGMTSLTTLDVSGNPLVNINALSDMKQLISVDLSDTPLSQSQIRYITNSLPSSVSIKSAGITGTSELSASVDVVKYYSALINVAITNISGSSSNKCGYYLSKSPVFSGEAGRVQKDITSGTLKVTGLEDGMTYYIWAYVKDSYGSIHISESVTVTTDKITDYKFTLKPAWPTYENDESAGCGFTGVLSSAAIMQEDNIIERVGNMTPVNGNYEISLPEGNLSMGFVAVEGTPDVASYDGYTWTFVNENATPELTLQLDSEDGCESDIALAIVNQNFKSDATVESGFVRPVAKLSFTVDFTGSVGNLSNIDNVSVKIIDHYSKCEYRNDSLQYSDLVNYAFSKKITEMPADKKVSIVEGRYVLPHCSNYSSSLSVTIGFKNGTSKIVKPNFDTDIKANNIYDFELDIVLTDSNGSFTVDVIERVEDNIEF